MTAAPITSAPRTAPAGAALTPWWRRFGPRGHGRGAGVATNGRGIESWRYGVVMAWLVLLVAGVLVLSIVKPVFVDRYQIGALPAFVVLTAIGITRLQPRGLAAGFLVVLDTVVLQPGRLDSAWDYDASRHTDGRHTDGQNTDGQNTDGEHVPVLLSTREWDDLTAAQVRSIPGRCARVWLLVTHLDPADRRRVRARFGTRFDLATTRRFPGELEVLRYDARG
jgi:hypothetical protein